MLKKGQVVEVYEDPFMKQHKEGNVKVIEHVLNLDPGVNQYKVCFVSDGFVAVRTIVEPCACYDPIHAGDNPDCPVHGKVESYVSS